MTGLVQLGPGAPEVRFRWLETLWVQVTGTLCNIACRHCFISCGPKAHQVPMMSADQIERALLEGRDAGMKQVYYTGGEPFLHPEMQRITRSALRLAPLTIVTNGLLVDGATAAWLAEENARSIYSLDLRVSLDGMTAEQNDPVRGRGTFAGVVAALRTLAAAGFSPIVTVVEHEERLQAIEARQLFIDFVRSLGIRQPRLKFLPLLRIGREEKRTHGYQDPAALDGGPLLPEVESSLLCSSGRVVTAHGVYTCPILIEQTTARLGDTLAAAQTNVRLRWDACQTCVIDGLRCNT